MRSLRRPLFLVVLVLALLTTGGLYVALGADPIRPVTPLKGSSADHEKTLGAETASVVADASPAELDLPSKAPADPRWAFLLLGYGGAGHDGAYLTDSIVLAIVDPSQKNLTLLSIPRDTWVPQLFDGKTAVFNKINTAFAFATDTSLYRNRLARYAGKRGAGSFLEDTVARLLGVPVSNYVALDFAGFKQMIDAVGGIDVDVPASFSSLYPANDDPEIDPSWTTVTFNKGKQHMTGERAIKFARAREAISNPSEGTDFARSRRQRMIIEAFKTRLFQPGGLIHIPQILGIAREHLDTDYAVPDVGQLGQMLLDWKDTHIYQTALTADNYLDSATGPGGTYVLVPDDPDRSWAQIRAFTKHLWQDPAAGVAMAETKIVVVNNTGQSGAATRFAAALRRLGYRVADPQSGTQRAQSHLVDRTTGSGKLVAAQLALDLGVRLPDLTSGDPTTPGQLVIELGSNDLALADFTSPLDNGAPSSAAGVSRQGWAPDPDPSDRDTSPEAAPAAVTPSPSRTRTPLRTPSATVLPSATVFPGGLRSPTTTATLRALTGTPTTTPRASFTATPTSTPTIRPTTATPTLVPASPTATTRPPSPAATRTPVVTTATATRTATNTAHPSPIAGP